MLVWCCCWDCSCPNCPPSLFFLCWLMCMLFPCICSLELFKLCEPESCWVVTWLLDWILPLVFCFLNSIISWSILSDICFNWSDNSCLFLLLVNSSPLPFLEVSFPYIIDDIDPRELCCGCCCWLVTTKLLLITRLTFSLDDKLLRFLSFWNSKDLSSYLLRLVDTLEAELG